jgi:ribosome-binding protein aMBF1 (putative translation factor)
MSPPYWQPTKCYFYSRINLTTGLSLRVVNAVETSKRNSDDKPMQRVSGKNDPEKLLSTLGLIIRERREHLSLSQEELASLTGIDRSHMGRIERGERNVTLLNLSRVAYALDWSLADMFAAARL